MDMVVVATVGTRFEADMIAAKLGSIGILWEIRSRQLVDATHPIGSIDVLVPVGEAADAVAALEPDAEWDAEYPSADRSPSVARQRQRSAFVLAGVAGVVLLILVGQVLANLLSAF
ncbi:MAG: hypothetical protein ACKOYM_01440 [Actinomycetes bacterium]